MTCSVPKTLRPVLVFFLFLLLLHYKLLFSAPGSLEFSFFSCSAICHTVPCFLPCLFPSLLFFSLSSTLCVCLCVSLSQFLVSRFSFIVCLLFHGYPLPLPDRLHLVRSPLPTSSFAPLPILLPPLLQIVWPVTSGCTEHRPRPITASPLALFRISR